MENSNVLIWEKKYEEGEEITEEKERGKLYAKRWYKFNGDKNTIELDMWEVKLEFNSRRYQRG